MPVNTRLAAPEVRYLLDDAQPSFLVVDDAFAPMLEALRPSLAGVRGIVHMGRAAPPAGTLAPAAPAALA